MFTRLQGILATASFLATALQASAQSQYSVVTPNDCLNLRSAGSRQSDIQTCLQDGTSLQVLSAANSSGFVKVRTASGQTGYVHGRQITQAAPQSAPRSPSKLASQSEFLTVESDEPAPRSIPPPRQASQPPSNLTSAAQTIATQPPQASPIQPAVDNGQCQNLQLVYSSEDVPDPKPGKSIIWGGNAAEQDDVVPMNKEFIAGAKAAKKAGHPTMAYLGGPCGLTNGNSVGNEVARCAAKFKKYNKAHPNELRIAHMPYPLPDKKEYRWLPYALAQLRMSKSIKLDYCEVDNLDSSFGWKTFYQIYKEMFDRGEIRCQLALKNPGAQKQFADIPKLFGRNPAFIGNVAIEEGDEEKGPVDAQQISRLKADLLPKLQAIKGPGAQLFVSKLSGTYRSENFTQDTVRHCERPDIQTAANDGQPQDQPEAAK